MNNLNPKFLTETAREAVLYANTASFLLEKLRRDSAIQSLRLEHSPEQLFEILARAEKVSSAPEVAWKYLLIVSIATSEWEERWERLSSLDLGDVDWGSTLWKMVKAENVPTSTVRATIGHPLGTAFNWSEPGLLTR